MFAALMLGLGLSAATPAAAAINLVRNGDFEQTTLQGSYGFGDRYAANQVTDWTSSG
jgi:hypothetical protein